MLNSNLDTVDMDVLVDPVAKLFCKESLGIEYNEIIEFALEFTKNISNQNLVIFSEEIERLVA